MMTAGMQSVRCFALVVVRGNGVDRELLPNFYKLEADAFAQARHFLTLWRGVQIQVVTFNVPMAGAIVKPLEGA